MKSLINLFNAPYNKKYPIFALFRFFYWKLIRILKLKKIEYNLWDNKKIYIYYDSFQCMWIFYNYTVDYDAFYLIKDYVEPNDNVADVGSNMGFYTIWMSKFISRTGSIHSFEPNAENFSRLSNNCQLNKLDNVRLNKIAIGNENGKIQFTKSLDGENHIALNEVKDTETIECMKLDTYAENNGISKFSYIKVDIEGFELHLLLGAQKLLKSKSIDIIQLELNEQVLNSNSNINDVLETIKIYNYSLCKYNVNQKCLELTAYDTKVENYFIVSDLDIVNSKLNRKVK